MGSIPPTTQVFQAQLDERLLVDLEGRVMAVSDGYRRADSTPAYETAAFEGQILWELPPFATESALRDELHHLLSTTQRTKVPLAIPVTQGPFAEVEAYPLLSPDGDVSHYVLTFKRSPQKPVSNHERRLHKLIENSFDGLALFDAGGRTLFTSASFRAQLGYSENEPFTPLPLSHVHPDDAERFGQVIATLVDTPDGRFTTRIRVRTQQDTYRVLDINSRNLLHDPDIAALVTHARDITEDVALHEELQRAHAATKLALSAAHAISWDIKPGKKEGIYSESFAQYFGISEEEFAEKGAVAALHPSSLQDVPRIIDEVTGHEDFNLEFRGRDRKNNGSRWFASYGRAVRNEHGEIVRLTGVTWDITAQKRLAEERQALDQQIREGQKLESLGVLAGGIAHDFNNLLTAILGHANLASAHADGSQRMHLARIEEASLRASELCRQMLSYAGRSKFALQNTDLNRLIEETSSLLQVSLNKKASLALLLAPKLPAIEGDATQLRQVLMNLVLNAGEALGERTGQIAIRTEVIEAEQTYLDSFSVPDLKPGSYVQLKVEDTGEGMSPETAARIFEPFFSTKFTGRGLGLSAVLGIVKGHHGALRVESTLGEGTTFSVLFPVSTQTSEEPAPEPAVLSNEVFTGSVLLAEDEDTVRAVTQQMLESLGFNVISARNGAEAVSHYQPHMRAILMDLKMPELTGEEAWHALRARGVTTPMVVMSGHAEEAAMARLEGEPGVSFLPKPFTLELLRSHLNHVLQAK